MARLKWKLFLIAPLICGPIGWAVAYPYPERYFGHEIVVLSKEGQETRLLVDGRELAKDWIVSLSEVATIGATGVVIGSVSQGGNACDSSKFVISFTPGQAPKFDGPVGDCSSVEWTIEKNQIVFRSKATAARDGQQWVWRPESGFPRPTAVRHQVDAEKGWNTLRDRTVSHPMDLMGYGEIARQIQKLLGSDEQGFLPILSGVGSGKFLGDTFVGTMCLPHQCGSVEGLIVADIPTRKIYIAWKPDEKPILVRPSVQEWPEFAKLQLRIWSSKWTTMR